MREELEALVRMVSEARDPDAEDGFDKELIDAFLPALTWLEAWMPTEVRGLERLPGGPALLAGNHNAGITFLEPFFLGRGVYEHTGEPLVWLGHDTIVDFPLLGRFLVAGGVVRAGHAGADAALAAGHRVAVYPGGGREAFRPWVERHQVDLCGRTGFARVAVRHGVPIVPVLHLGGHDSFIILRRGASLAQLTGVDRLLRAPAFPVFLGLPFGIGVGPLFHVPLPTRCLVEVLEPIDVGEPDPDPPRERLEALSAAVQGRLQEAMDARAAEDRWGLRGRHLVRKLLGEP